MSKDEAWQFLQDAWWFAHSNGCIGNCTCGKDFDEIKEMLSV
jgi:hypothetical protein